ncbi:MAG: undecaprenyl/decaprenyl-phosphate alpha-N-acetylglucosaminyl 1-phosphate transferase [Oligoflexia bacterium]|nr:undecaprenyl/decaprenyl-phosphate alpha-N-acetylglucosaminyl 1-phosphate transferase [Oligoflexia bacterium]
MYLFSSSLGLMAFFISSLLSLMMIRINIQDVPNQRSSHFNPTPTAGGVGVALSFAIVFFLSFQKDTKDPTLLAIIICSILMGIFGLVDDVKKLAFYQKLLAQIILATIIVTFGIEIISFSFPTIGEISLPKYVSVILTVLWIVGFSNAFNFMDGLNGHASVGALGFCILLILLSLNTGHSTYLQLASILFFSVMGFFIFNFPRGKIFLGDSGSLFLGFFIASLTVYISRDHTIQLSIYSVPLLFFSFIYDAFFTFLRRLIKGENVWTAHRSHLFQLLNRSGYSHLKVTLIQALFVFTQGIGAYFLKDLTNSSRIFLFIPYLALQIFYTLLIFSLVKKKKILV